MSFRFIPLELPGLTLIEETRRGDARGFFAETFKESEFRAAGIPGPFVQDNHARSARGVLRGMHYQLPPKPQGKLIRVVSGEVFDVAVDLRKGSPTYGRWAGVRLSGDEGRLLWVPPGFAHGYVVLSETSDFMYKVTAEYDAALDRGVRWNDPAIGIEWPMEAPVLSDRDVRQPMLVEADNPFVFE
jgi:dTDP-4-dehydrorhamnose 3,5-epimerase